MTLSNPVVGLFSSLALQFTTEHQLPANGKFQLTLPKWNSQDPTQANWVSLISVAQVPGPVSCTAASGIISATTTCFFSSGTTSDTLSVQLSEIANVTAGATINLVIYNFRAPPSLTPLTGFSLQTTTSSEQILD